jgi:hypothetical protein
LSSDILSIYFTLLYSFLVPLHSPEYSPLKELNQKDKYKRYGNGKSKEDAKHGTLKSTEITEINIYNILKQNH